MAKKSTASAQTPTTPSGLPKRMAAPVGRFFPRMSFLDQPNFFEHDFLPTSLGLGGVRDRGYLARVTLERKLAETYCALIVTHMPWRKGEAQSAGRCNPIARPRHHDQIVLITAIALFESSSRRRIRTDSGYRHQREAGRRVGFQTGWGTTAVNPHRVGFRGWLSRLESQPLFRFGPPLITLSPPQNPGNPGSVKNPLPRIQVVFGGGPFTDLAASGSDAWPSGEPVLDWRVCSPFWPGADSKTTPFESIAASLLQRGASLEQTELELICMADVPGDHARPVFPFPLLRGLRERQFPVTRGRIVPARLETLENEVPGSKSRRPPGTSHQMDHTSWPPNGRGTARVREFHEHRPWCNDGSE